MWNFDQIFCENYVLLETLSGGIFISVLISEFRSLQVEISVPDCHIAFNFNYVFIQIVWQFKFCQETFSSQWSSKSHVLSFAGTNIHTVVPHCIHHQLDFPQKVYNLHYRHFIDAVVTRGIFVSLFLKKLCGGVCWQHDYPYHVATLHATSVTFSMKIMHWSEFYQRAFSSQCSLRTHMVECVGMTAHTM
jgi:hypothetical protein